jgi:hypothetical protein
MHGGSRILAVGGIIASIVQGIFAFPQAAGLVMLLANALCLWVERIRPATTKPPPIPRDLLKEEITTQVVTPTAPRCVALEEDGTRIEIGDDYISKATGPRIYRRILAIGNFEPGQGRQVRCAYWSLADRTLAHHNSLPLEFVLGEIRSGDWVKKV